MQPQRRVCSVYRLAWILLRGGVGGAIFAGLAACTTASLPDLNPLLSPPVAAISDKPWQDAERMLAQVPNGMLMVGHGASMLPLYPNGTVVVLQAQPWDELRAGMTVVFRKEADAPFDVVAHVLKNRVDGAWETQGVNNDQPDDVQVTRKNYLGIVVAAYIRITPGTRATASLPPSGRSVGK